MKNAFTLARRDKESYLHSWMGIFILTSFFFLTGLFFSVILLNYGKLSMEAMRHSESVRGITLTRFVFSSFFLNLAALLMFVVPMLSMRAFAEERKQQTLELLFTYPLSDFEIVWGKWMGMTWFFTLVFLPTLSYAAFIYGFGGALDWGPVLIGYLGFWLLGIAYLSLGLFISSAAENPMLSAAVTFVCLILFWILDWVAAASDGWLAQFFSAISPLGRYRDFAYGILDLSNAVYFIFFYLYFLFLTMRSIERRNWKG